MEKLTEIKKLAMSGLVRIEPGGEYYRFGGKRRKNANKQGG